MPAHLISRNLFVMCVPPRLLITSDMIWTPYDWLNKFYSLYIAAIVSIISRHDFTIEIQLKCVIETILVRLS